MSDFDSEVNKFVQAFDGTVSVFCEKYERFGGGQMIRKKYNGPSLIKILERIHEVHSYGIDLDEMTEELGRTVTPTDLITQLLEINGDGCDYIIDITTNGVVLEIGDIENLEEEEEEDLWDEDGEW